MRKYAMAPLGALLFAALLATGCKPTVEITGKERETILKTADPMTDNLMTAFNAGDYATYSRDFNEPLKKALNDKKFKETRTMITGKLGVYKSRVLNTVVRKGKYDIVIYSAVFEKERGVQVRVVLEKAKDVYKLAGLWFNSPKLRAK